MKYRNTILAGFGGFLLGMLFFLVLFKTSPGLAELAFSNSYVKPERAEEPADNVQLFAGDPFAEAERMHKGLAAQGFPGLMTFGGGEEQNVVEREDDKAVYYEISGIDQTKLSTRVDDGYLTIKGETKQEKGGNDSGFSAVMQSSFQRSFPLPPNVDAKKMEMSSEKDKVILRFPKKG